MSARVSNNATAAIVSERNERLHGAENSASGRPMGAS
jgi:hypothetical protein